MADFLRPGLAASSAAGGHQSGRTAHTGRRHTGLAFHHVLAAAMTNAGGPRNVQASAPGIQTALLQAPLPMAHPNWVEKPAGVLPAKSDAALTRAMALEGVPLSWQSGLRFIMAQESGGQVNVRNPVHSARGLFQLTAANYHLNPNGAGSFGNAVEEAQGGIRYIQQRYGTADNAVAFWQQHHWY
jgi:hypothetical protein